MINNKLGKEGLNSTINGRNLCRDKIRDKKILICIHVGDFFAGVSEKTTANGLFDMLAEDIDFVQQVILNSFNEVDIDQHQEYIQIYALSYLNKILDGHR